MVYTNRIYIVISGIQKTTSCSKSGLVRIWVDCILVLHIFKLIMHMVASNLKHMGLHSVIGLFIAGQFIAEACLLLFPGSGKAKKWL